MDGCSHFKIVTYTIQVLYHTITFKIEHMKVKWLHWSPYEIFRSNLSSNWSDQFMKLKNSAFKGRLVQWRIIGWKSLNGSSWIFTIFTFLLDSNNGKLPLLNSIELSVWKPWQKTVELGCIFHMDDLYKQFFEYV